MDQWADPLGPRNDTGHFATYWWTLFDSHNDWLEEGAACKRRRYATGSMAHDPDKPKPRQKEQELRKAD